MAFVFGTQARPYQKQSSHNQYVPLYTATVVIAVNRNGNSMGSIRGWRTLLESPAVVLIPHHATEGGRLTAIALARGLGATKGDLIPAIEAYTDLQAKCRLNRQAIYQSTEYQYMCPPDKLAEHDAIVLWDYQAAMLTRSSNDWDIIMPEEGTLSVDCGFVYNKAWAMREDRLLIKEFLLSEQGRLALANAGFSALADETDLSAWDMAKLTYNPDFRRAVLSVKLYGPASVQERLWLQSLTILLFCIAAQRILQRVPQGLHRMTSVYCLLFVLLWMLIGIIKTLSIDHDMTRYIWFATYIPRHILPVCWFCMCYVNRYGRLPSKKWLTTFTALAVLLTALVFTNDFHHFVFIYTTANPAMWASQYSNAWGYYLSLLGSFSLVIAGSALLFHKNRTRRQNRQMLYAGILMGALLVYQALYIFGVQYIVDLDIPTTVAGCILVFILALQQERFMGASLLELPIFKNSPYGIAIYDGAGHTVYSNDVMERFQNQQAMSPCPKQALYEAAEVSAGERIFKPHVYMQNTSRALILEDITDLKRLEGSRKETHNKLKAVQKLLVKQAEDARSLTDKLEQERYFLQMEGLLKNKLDELRRLLHSILEGAGEGRNNGNLRRIRFFICICQRRLRFIIRSLEAHPLLPAVLIERYAAGVIQDGQRMGLDGVITADSSGFCPAMVIAPILEAIDSISLCAFDLPGSSIIYRLDANNFSLTLNALLSWEEGSPAVEDAMLPEALVRNLRELGGEIHQDAEEDGLLTRLHVSFQEVRA
ncbi:MAG: histidine kinase N-terminal 7TM domain-containing protein [Candidatus Pelethousia sp.]|nr:histidine kinase N-terminal 7TM domain-containing protein [Candidatus Pelethousia sp.]